MRGTPAVPPRPHLLVAAVALSLAAPLYAADTNGPACPVGVFRCAKKADDFALCKPNALLEFYVPGLPPGGDRENTSADFTADRFQSSDRSKYVLEGQARVQRLDQLLQADTLTYDNDTTAYVADGNVRYQDSGLLMAASHASGTTVPDHSTLKHVRYQILSSRGNGTAERAAVLDSDTAALNQVTYSTCDPDDRAWEFSAKDLAIDRAEGIGRGHDLTMRWRGVPFFWLPYARFPIDDRRQSGFLYPQIGGGNSNGLDLTLPYYLNLAPNYDATLYPRIIGQRGLMFGGEFRYLQPSHRGLLEFTWLPHDRDADRERSYVHFEDYGVLSPNWSVAVNLSYVSDDRYFEDFGRTLTSAATSLLPSSAYLNGRGTWWTASVGADRYQITDPILADQYEPYRRLPRAMFEGEHELFGGLYGGLRSEFVSFRKEDALEGQRLDLYPYLAYPFEGASYFVRPEIGWRTTRYQLDRDVDSSPTRTMPISSLDAGLVFERDVNWFGQAFLQTLEPRLYYLHVPYRNQDDLPVFDTQEISFDFGQLFRPNRYTGADRQMDANHVTLALTSRLLETDSGVERVSASVGQIRYLDNQRVQLPGLLPTDFSGSDYVAELDLRLSDRWRIQLADQWDPNHDRTDLATVGVQNRFGRDGIVNLSYRYRRDFLEQVDAATLVPLSERWRLIGRYNYSLRDDKALETVFGIEHDDCCTAWRLIARRYVHNIEGEFNNALYFELEFKGIGAVGQRTDDFLRRGILGYR